MWYVIGLIPLALIAGVIWVYNKKLQQRNAERNKQAAALLSDVKAGHNPVKGAAGGSAAQAAMVLPAAAPVFNLSKKQRLLPPAEALLYYVFKTGLPDHEIFAGLTLADVIEAAPALRGHEREQKKRQLAQQRLELVVCTKQLEIIAAVIVNNMRDDAQAGNRRFAEECLRMAGVRLVRIDPAAPPRHQQVRELVYGAGPGS